MLVPATKATMGVPWSHGSSDIDKTVPKLDDKTGFTCYSFNIQTHPVMSYTKTSVLEWLLYHRPSILLLQELQPDVCEWLEQELDEYEVVYAGCHSKNENNAILFDTRVWARIDSGNFFLSPSGNPEKAFGEICIRNLVWVILEHVVVHQKLFVIDTHWDHGPQTARIEEAKMIVERIPQLNKEGAMIVIGADFNSEKDSDEVVHLRKGLELQEPETTFGGNPSFIGWPGKSEYPMTHRIDHIFYTEGPWRCTQYGVTNDAARNMSDHLPVVSIFEYSGDTKSVIPDNFDTEFEWVPVEKLENFQHACVGGRLKTNEITFIGRYGDFIGNVVASSKKLSAVVNGRASQIAETNGYEILVCDSRAVSWKRKSPQALETSISFLDSKGNKKFIARCWHGSSRTLVVGSCTESLQEMNYCFQSSTYKTTNFKILCWR